MHTHDCKFFVKPRARRNIEFQQLGTVNCRDGFGQHSQPAHMKEERELQSMGNRDARGREKKKPKKAVVKPSGQPPRPTTVYKPVPPTPPAQEKSNS